MNYVSHLFLAAPDHEHRVGSILADFSVGTIEMLRDKYTKRVAEGIRHHRLVDRFTDDHPEVIACTDLFKSGFGMYSGIIVDVVFDHFLLRHWQRFSEGSQQSFFDSVYHSLAQVELAYPPRYQETIARMLERRWLDIYIDVNNVAYALKRINERFSMDTPLVDTLPAILENYDALDQHFLRFFPALQQYAATADCSL